MRVLLLQKFFDLDYVIYCKAILVWKNKQKFVKQTSVKHEFNVVAIALCWKHIAEWKMLMYFINFCCADLLILNILMQASFSIYLKIDSYSW